MKTPPKQNRESSDHVFQNSAAALRVGLVFPLNRCELCPLRDGPGGAPDLVAPRFDELCALILGQP